MVETDPNNNILNEEDYAWFQSVVREENANSNEKIEHPINQGVSIESVNQSIPFSQILDILGSHVSELNNTIERITNE
ncbi:11899_t:CDS:2, partial [Racocetra fulgida]